MTDDTTILQKEEIPSHFFQLSIRAWLALMFGLTSCLVELTRVAVAFYVKDYLDVKPSSEFILMCGMIITFYFKEKNPATEAKA